METPALLLSSEFEAAYVGPCRDPAPERRLMIAVLEDAIRSIRRSRILTNAWWRRVFEEEKRWFLSEDRHSPFSFECICETLELDPNAVRESLGLVPRAPSFGADGDAHDVLHATTTSSTLGGGRGHSVTAEATALSKQPFRVSDRHLLVRHVLREKEW
jgi:hypothetical protein